jgi:hypothetical protein
LILLCSWNILLLLFSVIDTVSWGILKFRFGWLTWFLFIIYDFGVLIINVEIFFGTAIQLKNIFLVAFILLASLTVILTGNAPYCNTLPFIIVPSSFKPCGNPVTYRVYGYVTLLISIALKYS